MTNPTIEIITIGLILTTIFSLRMASRQQKSKKDKNDTNKTDIRSAITEQEIVDTQKAWADSIIKIGKVYSENGDYRSVAIEHIKNFYNYQEGTVLFKPTLTSEKQFRTDFRGALSYFIGGDENYPEDIGFATKQWKSIRWENIAIKTFENLALAMGNYYFTSLNGDKELKVEYSFVYIKNNEGKLKIILHDSHLPYSYIKKN